MMVEQPKMMGLPAPANTALPPPAVEAVQALSEPPHFLLMDGNQQVRLISLVWAGYFLLLALLDRSFLMGSPDRGVAPVHYYLGYALIALVVLVLTGWSWLRARLGRLFLPGVIVWLTITPFLLTMWLEPPLPQGRIEATLGWRLRMLPVQFMILQLVASQYSWPQVVIYSVATGLLILGSSSLTTGSLHLPEIPFLMMSFILPTTYLMVGTYLSTLLHRVRTQQASLEQANRQLRSYASTLEHLAVSRERNRMARELHDTLAHTLTALTVQLETANAYWEVDPQAAKGLLDRSLVVAREGVQETRRALRALRASPLDSLGLVLALRQLAESAAQRADMALDLSLPTITPTLPPEIEQSLYRIAQEAVANVIHHAGARCLTLRLTIGDADISLLVADDGRGFNQQHALSPGHYGLAGMHERAHLIGATLTIVSQPGSGTTIQVKV